MLHIVFEYKDKYTGDRWSQQECTVSSVAEYVKLYGLGIDCEYRIISIKELKGQLMKNKLTDLNNHLFAALERLNDESLTPEEVEREINRGNAVATIGAVIVKNAATQLQAYKLASENGMDANVKFDLLISNETNETKGKQCEVHR